MNVQAKLNTDVNGFESDTLIIDPDGTATKTHIPPRPCVVPRGDKFMLCWDRWSQTYSMTDEERRPLVTSTTPAILMDGLTREDLMHIQEEIAEALK